MKMITEPKVYLVGRPSVAEGLGSYFSDNNIYVERKAPLQRLGMMHPDNEQQHDIKEWTIEEVHSDAELLCMSAGKICYDAFGRGRSEPSEYLGNILEQGHGSVLEHASWNFVISGVSRTFSHEHVRHRIGVAISQRSQRYVKESEAGFITQKIIRNNPLAAQVFDDSVENSARAYNTLCDLLEKDLEKIIPNSTARLKVIRSAARSVMPNATETILFWTANGRALRHYIDMRASKAAEIEIRNVAVQILRIMKKEAPSLFSDYEIVELWDGSEIAQKTRKTRSESS